jgi:hypothetical protein
MDAIQALTGQKRADSYNEPPAKGIVEKVRRRLLDRFRL